MSTIGKRFRSRRHTRMVKSRASFPRDYNVQPQKIPLPDTPLFAQTSQFLPYESQIERAIDQLIKETK